MLEHAGVVVVWHAGKPRLDPYRLPAEGLVIGRELLGEDDDRISRHHARVRLVDNLLELSDMGSRNGTFLERSSLIERQSPQLPAIVRAGRTVFVMVNDVRPFEKEQPAKRGSLQVGASLDRAVQAVDEAARAENNVTLVGDLGVGRELAIAYANVIGGGFVVFDGNGPSLTEIIERAGEFRTVIIEFNRLLEPAEVETLALYVETDIRFAFACEASAAVESLPPEVLARLVRHKIVFPTFRFDVLPLMARDIVAEIVPGAVPHATVIELVLSLARRIAEGQLMQRLRDSVVEWARTREPDNLLLRVRNLIDELESYRPGDCVVIPRRAIRTETFRGDMIRPRGPR